MDPSTNANPSWYGDSAWLPEAVSTMAGDVDYAFYFIGYVSIAFFVLIVLILFYFPWAYRKREGAPPVKQIAHNTVLEILWSVVPLLFLFVMFVLGLQGYMKMSIAPRGATEIQLTARKWSWSFEYPGGLKSIAGKNGETELHVPVGKPVKLIMSSEDVLHSFFLPTFRLKQDVVPGRYTTLWLEATKEGTYPIFCTEYCGLNHSKMVANVVVDSEENYNKYLATIAELDSAPPEEIGKAVFVNSCKGCHSVDGTRVVGPSLKGLFGKKEKLVGGAEVEVDEEYIRESLEEPNAKVVDTYPPVMSPFKGTLTKKEVDGLIAYIKSIK